MHAPSHKNTRPVSSPAEANTHIGASTINTSAPNGTNN
jgi:hypothetical protein